MKDAIQQRTSALRIQTPEGVTFSMPLAGPVTRLLALTVDLACIGAAMSIMEGVLALTQVLSFDLFYALSLIGAFLVPMGYGMAAEWFWRGQTVGKRVMHLRVVDVGGLRLRFSQVMVRNLLRAVDSLPAFYLVGGAVCFLSSRYQRIGDIAANTVVIREPRVSQPNLDRLLQSKFNSLREYPYLAARLRQRISPWEARVALQALMRRDELEPRARVELFGQLAGHFRSVVEFPEEAVYGISDEQYLSNVVDIIYRERTPKGRAKVAKQ